MNKRIFSLLTISVLSLSLTGQSYASSSTVISVQVNGNLIKMQVPPLIENGRTLVAVREISELLGYNVGWDSSSKTVYLNNKNNVSYAQNPSKERIVVNGNPISSDIQPQIYQGRTMVPLRVISEATGAIVNWNQQERTVTINTENHSSISFPQSLKINYEKASFEGVPELQSIPEDWSKKSSLSLGEINNNQILMNIYEEKRGNYVSLNGVFTFNNKIFVVKDINSGTSNSILNTNLNLKVKQGEHSFNVLSGVGNDYETNLIMYDATDQKWLYYKVLGKPVKIVDYEGGFEIYLQFPGKNLVTKKVTTLGFNNGEFNIADISQAFRPLLEQLQVDAGKMNTVFQLIDNKPAIKVSILYHGSEENQMYMVISNGSLSSVK